MKLNVMIYSLTQPNRHTHNKRMSNWFVLVKEKEDDIVWHYNLSKVTDRHVFLPYNLLTHINFEQDLLKSNIEVTVPKIDIYIYKNCYDYLFVKHDTKIAKVVINKVNLHRCLYTTLLKYNIGEVIKIMGAVILTGKNPAPHDTGYMNVHVDIQRSLNSN